MENISIKVNTEQLLAAAGNVSSAIDKMERIFSDVEKKVYASSVYWEGDGNNKYVSNMKKKQDTINIAIKRFRENVTDLQNIANNYNTAESANNKLIPGLPSDVIN